MTYVIAYLGGYWTGSGWGNGYNAVHYHEIGALPVGVDGAKLVLDDGRAPAYYDEDGELFATVAELGS